MILVWDSGTWDVDVWDGASIIQATMTFTVILTAPTITFAIRLT